MIKATVRIDQQRDCIKNLKKEQRLMAGVLHRVSSEYCFESNNPALFGHAQGNGSGPLPK